MQPVITLSAVFCRGAALFRTLRPMALYVILRVSLLLPKLVVPESFFSKLLRVWSLFCSNVFSESKHNN